MKILQLIYESFGSPFGFVRQACNFHRYSGTGVRRDSRVRIEVPRGRASSLRDTLVVVLKDGALRSRLGQSGRAYARNYPWDSVAREFERTLESVVDEKH
jgi:hypothetical protein